MSNKQIADIALNLPEPKTLIKADSAEPKSIDELRMYGLNVLPANKGQGSVNQGIQYLQELRIFVTKRSINLWKEYLNYLWEIDRDGKIINVPIDVYNHLLDAARYGLEKAREFENKKTEKQVESPLYGQRYTDFMKKMV